MLYMMLYSFGHVRATLLRLSMRTSLIFYFQALRALSNMSQHIATGWPRLCNNVVICCVEMLGAFHLGLTGPVKGGREGVFC